MSKYKFRGLGTDGHIYWGDLIHDRGKTYIREDYRNPPAEVDMDSLRCYVGVDKDGEEVYEGDFVTDGNVEGRVMKHYFVDVVPENVQLEPDFLRKHWKVVWKNGRRI